ncbi:MAG TPA: RHS repeat domain-containing protein, partial [Candidatus Omnitrophota bacterium]|nr:RHS repeat domain-containing protein [Candidatus Omnitrophota bacterium]
MTTYTYGESGSPVPTNSQLVAIQYPQGSTGSGLVEMTYHADGSLATRTDPRGVTLTFTYDDAYRRTEQTVSGTVPGDTKVEYTYTALGQPETITTSAGQAATSVVEYTYNGFGQIESESLDLDGDGPLPARTITYDYSGGSFSLLTGLTYPNGRQISYAYGATTAGHYPGSSAAGAAFGRIAEILDGDGQTAAPLAAYAYTGMNHMVARWHDHGHVAQAQAYDAFGRVTQVRHGGFDGQQGLPTDAGETTYAGSTYGYDLAGNRVFDKPLRMPAHGQAYQYDDLNRLVKATRGVLDGDHQVAAPYASPRTVDPTYDLLGNFLSDRLNSHVETREHNLANEITKRSVDPADDGVVDPGPALYLDETFGGTDPLDNWDIIAGAFSAGGGVATCDTVAAATGVPWSPQAKGLMLVEGLTNLTDIAVTAKVVLPERGTRAGIVFGYQDADNYWVCLLHWPSSGWPTVGIYQVEAGTWTARHGPHGRPVTITANTPVTFCLRVQGQGVSAFVVGQTVPRGPTQYAATGVLPGRVGVLAGQADIEFDDVRVQRADWSAPASPTWAVYRGTFALDGDEATLAPTVGESLNLAVRQGTYGKDYDIEVRLAGVGAGLAFHVQD